MNSKFENSVRKSYNSPQLVRYGGIRDLTKTSNGHAYLDCNNDAMGNGRGGTPAGPVADCSYNPSATTNRS